MGAQAGTVHSLRGLDLLGTTPKPIAKKDTAGEEIDWKKLEGKVVLLDFWATWCGPCIGEMPNVLAVYGKLHDKGFEVVGISLDKERAKLDEPLFGAPTAWNERLAAVSTSFPRLAFLVSPLLLSAELGGVHRGLRPHRRPGDHPEGRRRARRQVR